MVVAPHPAEQLALRHHRARPGRQLLDEAPLRPVSSTWCRSDGQHGPLEHHATVADDQLPPVAPRLPDERLHHGTEAGPARFDGRVDPGPPSARRAHRPTHTAATPSFERGHHRPTQPAWSAIPRKPVDPGRAGEGHGVDPMVHHRLHEALAGGPVVGQLPAVHRHVDHVGTGAGRARRAEVGLGRAVALHRDPHVRRGRRVGPAGAARSRRPSRPAPASPPTARRSPPRRRPSARGPSPSPAGGQPAAARPARCSRPPRTRPASPARCAAPRRRAAARSGPRSRPPGRRPARPAACGRWVRAPPSPPAGRGARPAPPAAGPR